jgi:hypothetical protein
MEDIGARTGQPWMRVNVKLNDCRYQGAQDSAPIEISSNCSSTNGCTAMSGTRLPTPDACTVHGQQCTVFAMIEVPSTIFNLTVRYLGQSFHIELLIEVRMVL